MLSYYKKIIAFFALTFFTLSAPDKAISASVSLGGDPGVECYATLRGVIATGDAEQLSLVLNDRGSQDGPLCLNSPGGSYQEGLKIMELVYEKKIPTAVTNGAKCLSACAVAFLGGSDYRHISYTSRFLHVNAELGFHAPFLEVPEGQYDANTVLSAFDLSMQSVTALIVWSERLNLPDRFLGALFSTGPDEMYLVDTAGKAADLSITLFGQTAPNELSDEMVRRACLFSVTREFGGFITDHPDSRIGQSVSLPTAGAYVREEIFEARYQSDRIAVVNVSGEAATSYFLCFVRYDGSRISNFTKYNRDGDRFDGGHGIIFTDISSEPFFSEFDQRPEITLPMVQEAWNISDVGVTDAASIRFELLIDPETTLSEMRSGNWWERDLIRKVRPKVRPSKSWKVFQQEPSAIHLGDEEIRGWEALKGRCIETQVPDSVYNKPLAISFEPYGLEKGRIVLSGGGKVEGISLRPQAIRLGKRPNYWGDRQEYFLDQRSDISSIRICTALMENDDYDDFMIRNLNFWVHD